jgi:serine/threonine-protein kinase HipA
VAEERVLAVILGGQLAATVSIDNRGRYALIYDAAWQATEQPTPVSLALPVARREHGDPAVRTFLEGLLPANDRVRDRWAQAFHVANQPIPLLRNVGADCAGAVQFLPPDRLAALAHGQAIVRWLEPAEIGAGLRALHADPSDWHARDGVRFCLGGNDPKTAVYRDASGQWADPSGLLPTTHILKVAPADRIDHDLNEHLCLTVAAQLGLRAAHTTVDWFDGIRALVVQRYDRRRGSDGRLSRVHQEDLGQALGVAAAYQNDGGPSPDQVMDLLRERVFPAATAAANVARFVDALVYNWLIAGTDAHARNYSVLLAGSQVRLAPLYDVSSSLGAPSTGREPELAMAIAGEYRAGAITGEHWRRFAAANKLDAVELLARIDDLARRLPAAITAAAGMVTAAGSPLPDRLARRVSARAQWCRAALS